MLKLIVLPVLFLSFILCLWRLRRGLRRVGITGLWSWHRDRPVRARVADEEPSPDSFSRLTREAMAFATQPGVSVMHHVAAFPQEEVLIRTTADPYARRAYVERLQLAGGQVVHVVCLYLDGAEAPSETGSFQFPAEQAGISVLRVRIEDIASEGSFLSFRDSAGRTRETRLPKDSRHHA